MQTKEYLFLSVKDLKIMALMFVMLFISTYVHAKDAPIDADCAKMAANAKSFATLKATGVATTPAQFTSFIVSPTVQTYPIRSILNYVFESDDKNPDQIYSALYGRCMQMGYKDLLEYFTEREAYTDLKAKNDELTVKLTNAEHDKGVLLQQVSQLREIMSSQPSKRRSNYVVDTTPLKVSGK